MNSFLISAAIISLLSVGLIFFLVPKKITSQNKLLIGLLALISITLLIVKVANFSALERDTTFSEDVATQLLKVRQSPNDIVAWNDLGRAYLLEQEYVNAYMAFTQSEQLDSYVGLGINEKQARSERLKWLTGLAEARVLAQDGNIDDQANEFIQRSLKIDEEHPKALWYGGLAAAQRANYEQAQELWNRLLSQNPPEPLKGVIQKRLNSLTPLLNSHSFNAESDNWALRFKLMISEALLSTQTEQSKIYASIRQNTQSPPVIAKSYDVQQWLSQNENILTLTSSDKIMGMAMRQSLDWEKPSTLYIIWAQDGKVLNPNNVRLEIEITKQNLDRVFEYTLE